MALTIGDLTWANGANNDAGIRSTLYWAPMDDVLTFPPTTAVVNTFADIATITTAFVMKTGKKFNTLYCTLETGGVESDQVGERDGHSYENKLMAQYPGNKAEILGFMEWAKNTNLVFIAQETDGQYRVFGSAGLPAEIQVAKSKTGVKISEMKCVNFTVRSIGRIAPVYTAAVPLTPAA